MRVLDTDTLILLLRGNPKVTGRWRSAGGEFVTTAICAGELLYGAAKSSEPETNLKLVQKFLSCFRVLGLSAEACLRFWNAEGESRKVWKPLG